MPFSAGEAAFKLAFQISPIMFVGGIAGQTAGAMVPIIAYTEAANFVTGLLSGTQNIELDNFYAHFKPLPGSTLLDLEIGNYPFANQAVAANATISNPLQLSMLMVCPVRNFLGYPLKLATMSALQQVVTQHAQTGGTYTIVTPAGFYSNGILTALRDVSSQETFQVQNSYQWDFTFPLLTLQQAQQAQNNMMSKLSSGTQVTGTSWSGVAPTVGAPDSLATANFVPAASSLPASTISPAADGVS